MSERAKKPEGGDKAAPDAAEGGAAAPRASADPRQAKWQAIVRSATQYNAAHADLVAEFNKLTGGKCAGENAGVSVRELRKWQMDHGLPADGKIGPKTIAAAKKESKAKPDGKDEGGEKSDVEFSDKEAGTIEGKAGDKGDGGGQKSDVTFSDKEAGTVEGKGGGGKGKKRGQKSDVTFGDNAAGNPMEPEAASAGGGEKSDVSFDENAAGNPMDPEAADGGLADAAVAGGEAGGEEKREKKTEDPSAEGGGMMQETADKLGNDMAGEGHELGVGVAARLALVPHIVNLLRAHKFKEAVDYIKGSATKSDIVEMVKAVTEKLTGELGEVALQAFRIAATAGLVADVLKLGWAWTYGGIKAVQEAHEHGDRDARIGIYAWAWADCVLTGKHDNPGAVGEDQREAMSLGMIDGLATRDQSPELPFLLIAEYGKEDNARHALQDALYKRAGITGIKTHAGK